VRMTSARTTMRVRLRDSAEAGPSPARATMFT
jgi:hypothetical protein